MYRLTKVLENFNKDLISFAEEKEPELRGAALHLFGSAFTKQVAEHLELVETLQIAKGKTKKIFQGPPCKGRRGGKGRQTLQPCRDGMPSAAQRNSGVNFKEIKMTIKYRAKGFSRHEYLSSFANKCKQYDAKTACCGVCHRLTTTKQSSSYRQTWPLCRKLESFHYRTVSTEYCSRVSNSFQEEPKQDRVPHPYQYPADQLIQLQEELALLVSKGAITHLEPTTLVTNFYSTMFLVPKKRVSEDWL